MLKVAFWKRIFSGIIVLGFLMHGQFGCKPVRKYPDVLKQDTLKVFYAVAHALDSNTVCLQKNTQVFIFIPQFSTDKVKFEKAINKFNHYLASITFPSDWFKLSAGLSFKQKKRLLRAGAQAFAETNAGFPLVYKFGLDSLFFTYKGIINLKMVLLFKPCGSALPILDYYYITADLSVGKIYQPDSSITKRIFECIKNGCYFSTTYPKKHLQSLKQLEINKFSRRLQIFVTDSVYAWINPPHGELKKKGKFALPKEFGQDYLGKTVYNIIINYYKKVDKKYRQDEERKSMYSSVYLLLGMPTG